MIAPLRVLPALPASAIGRGPAGSHAACYIGRQEHGELSHHRPGWGGLVWQGAYFRITTSAHGIPGTRSRHAKHCLHHFCMITHAGEPAGCICSDCMARNAPQQACTPRWAAVQHGISLACMSACAAPWRVQPGVALRQPRRAQARCTHSAHALGPPRPPPMPPSGGAFGAAQLHICTPLHADRRYHLNAYRHAQPYQPCSTDFAAAAGPMAPKPGATWEHAPPHHAR